MKYSHGIARGHSRLALLVSAFAVLALAGEDRAVLPKALNDGQHPQRSNRQLVPVLTMPSFPERMLVYKRENPTITAGAVADQSAVILQTSGPVRTKRTTFNAEGRLDERPFRLEVDRATGAFILEDIEFYAAGSSVRSVGAFPDASASKGKATAFLKGHNLLPEDAYLRGVVDNTKGADVMSVGFGRRVNGIEVWGAGSEIIVDIGREERVVRIRKAWPTLSPIGQYELARPAAAIQKLKDGEGVLYNGQRGEIVALKLVYYVSPTVQDYVQPCYYADCRDPDTGKAFYGVVDAIESK